jgi:hypothetical protein
MRKVGLKLQKNKRPRAPEAVIERGVREGWITPASNPGGALPERNPVPGLTLEQLPADLDPDRADPWC